MCEFSVLPTGNYEARYNLKREAAAPTTGFKHRRYIGLQR